MSDQNPLYGDACEKCGTYDVLPQSAIRDGAHYFIAGYGCPNCAYPWTCAWQIIPGRSIPPEPQPDSPDFDAHVSALVLEMAAISRARKHLSRNDPDT